MYVLIKFWKEGLLALLILSTSALLYNKIYSRAELETSKKYVQQFKEYSDKLESRIGNIQDSSYILSTRNEEQAVVLDKKLAAILVASRGKVMYEVKEGKCTLSPNFLDSYNQLITGGGSK
jgi:hypothetical protein